MCPELQTPVWIAAAFQLNSTLLVHIMMLNFIKCKDWDKALQVTGLTFSQPISCSCWWPPKWSDSFERGLRAAQTRLSSPARTIPGWENVLLTELRAVWPNHGVFTVLQQQIFWSGRMRDKTQPQLGLRPALLVPWVQERADSDKDSCQKEKLTH